MESELAYRKPLLIRRGVKIQVAMPNSYDPGRSRITPPMVKSMSRLILPSI